MPAVAADRDLERANVTDQAELLADTPPPPRLPKALALGAGEDIQEVGEAVRAPMPQRLRDEQEAAAARAPPAHALGKLLGAPGADDAAADRALPHLSAPLDSAVVGGRAVLGRRRLDLHAPEPAGHAAVGHAVSANPVARGCAGPGGRGRREPSGPAGAGDGQPLGLPAAGDALAAGLSVGPPGRLLPGLCGRFTQADKVQPGALLGGAANNLRNVPRAALGGLPNDGISGAGSRAELALRVEIAY